MAIERKTRTRANKAVDKVRKIVQEIKSYTGKKPKVVTVTVVDFMAMTECNYINDGKLSGTDIEIKT